MALVSFLDGSEVTLENLAELPVCGSVIWHYDCLSVNESASRDLAEFLSMEERASDLTECLSQ